MTPTTDRWVRLVSAANLRAMCEYSGIWWIEKVTRSRVWVGARIGTKPVFAVFPCFPNLADGLGDHTNPLVVLDYLNVLNVPRNQADKYFADLLNSAPMFRDITGTWCPVLKGAAV